MAQTNQSSQQQSQPQKQASADQPEQDAPIAPRWQALIGIIVLAIINIVLPANLTLGPVWLLPVIEAVLLIPLLLEWMINRPLSYRIRRSLMFLLLGVVTLGMMSAIIFLILTLSGSSSSTKAVQLLHDAALIWASNILVFSLWYWEVDGGGPAKRRDTGHQAVDFMFPQQVDGNTSGWVPHFFDYVFLAFTAATALSPTDTFPLSRSAKALMMVQAIISLVVIVLLAARAVNIL